MRSKPNKMKIPGHGQIFGYFCAVLSAAILFAAK